MFAPLQAGTAPGRRTIRTIAEVYGETSKSPCDNVSCDRPQINIPQFKGFSFWFPGKLETGNQKPETAPNRFYFMVTVTVLVPSTFWVASATCTCTVKVPEVDVAGEETGGVLVPQPASPRNRAITRHTSTNRPAPIFLFRAPEPTSNIAGNSANARPYRLGKRRALVVEGGTELVAMVRIELCPGLMFAGLNKHTNPGGNVVWGGLGTHDRVNGGCVTVKPAGTLMVNVAVPPALIVASLGLVTVSVGTVTEPFCVLTSCRLSVPVRVMV